MGDARAADTARALASAGRHAEACAAFRQAIAAAPGDLALLVACARSAEQARDWPLAEKAYRGIGTLRPASGYEAPLGAALLQQMKFAEAVPLFRTHLARAPGDAAILHGLGLALGRLQRWEEALECGRVLERDGQHDKALDILVASLFYLGMGDELDRRLDDAMRRHPDNHDLLSVCSLHLVKRGRLREGFALRRRIHPRYYRPGAARNAATDITWDGEPFDGMLLVAGEQGLGEEMLAARLYPLLATRCRQITVECNGRLLALMQRSFPAIHFVARDEGHLDRIAASGEPCRVTRSLDLPALLLPDGQLPPGDRWLVPDAQRVAALRAILAARAAGHPHVGLSWSSSRLIHGQDSKSIPPPLLSPLFTDPAPDWVNLQYGEARRALDGLPFGARIHEPEVDVTADIDGLLALIAALDAVVTVSNTTAHAAGAIGARCHLLLPHAQPVFWYWGYSGDRTPWYPSLRIWRNDADNDWTPTLQRLARDGLP